MQEQHQTKSEERGRNQEEITELLSKEKQANKNTDLSVKCCKTKSLGSSLSFVLCKYCNLESCLYYQFFPKTEQPAKKQEFLSS